MLFLTILQVAIYQFADDEFWVLKDNNIKISKGKSVGLYGPNGSGKTTIIKILANVTHPTRGEAVVKGRVSPLISPGEKSQEDTGR